MREPRGYNVVPAAILGLMGTAAAGIALKGWMNLDPRFVWLAILVHAALLLVVVTAAKHQHPFPGFGAANVVTMVRATMTALVAGTVAAPPSTALLWFAIALVLLVAVSDGADGYLARRSGMASGFGARFDMETDAALICVLSVLVWQHHKAGAWVLLCGLMRYAFVAAGWVAPWLARPLRSTRRGKTVAVAQFIALGVALAPVTPLSVSTPLAAVALAALTWSFALDVWWLRRSINGTVGHHAK